ncbi:MAG: hypothetical protein EZS28_043609, partial [Streblomastix strix]
VLDHLPDGEATACLANAYARSDHIPPLSASSAVTIKDTINGVVGINNIFACSDHAHPLNVIATIPKFDQPVGTTGTSLYYARADHVKPCVYSTATPMIDYGTGVVGNQAIYARANHAHPANYNPNQFNVPTVNQAARSNPSATYSVRSDNIHPKQSIHTDNIMATASIKTEGLPTHVLMDDGHVKELSIFVLWGDSTTGLWENNNVLYYNGKQVLLAD